MLVIFKENVILILSFWLDYDNLVNCFAVNKNQREIRHSTVNNDTLLTVELVKKDRPF